MPSPDNLFEFMRDIEGNIAFKKFSIGLGSDYPDSYGIERILKNVDKFQYGTESTQAVSTGVAHDKIDSLMDKKKEIEPSLLDFIRNAVSTIEGLEPEETPYGQAIAQIVKESYSPHIKQMDIEGFEKYGNVWREEIPRPKEADKGTTSISYGYFDERTKTRRKEYKDEYDEKTKKWYRITPRAFFKTPIFDDYPKTSEYFSHPDTAFVPYGDVSTLLAELPHSIMYGPLNTEERRELKRRTIEEKSLHGEKVYRTPDTSEDEAHNLIEPVMIERFKTLLDSLPAPITVESLFQNQ